MRFAWCLPAPAACFVGFAAGQSPHPTEAQLPDRSAPSRVRFAASRPGLFRADPRGWLFMRGKGGLVA